MDPFTIGSLVLGGVQTISGLLQRRAARKRRERAMADFQYDIPSAVTEQLQTARERASRRGLPGEDITRARAESDLAETVSRGEGVAESAADLLGLYAKAYGQKTDLYQDLIEGGAKYQAQRELEVDRAMNLMAEAQGQQFHYNRYVPFLSEMGYAGQQAQSGAANIAGGLQTAYQAWANDWMMGKMMGADTNQGPGLSNTELATKATRDNLTQQSKIWQQGLPQPKIDYRTPLQSMPEDPYSPYRIRNIVSS